LLCPGNEATITIKCQTGVRGNDFFTDKYRIIFPVKQDKTVKQIEQIKM